MKRAAPGQTRRGPEPCPCCSGRAFEACCAPYHRGEREAPDAVALMRSRYAAFARRDAEYLAKTVAAEHPDRQEPADLARALSADRRRYPKLAILDHRERPKDAEVLFHATVIEGSRDVSFVELSDFVREGVGWRYASGILVPARELADPTALDINAFLALDRG